MSPELELSPSPRAHRPTATSQHEPLGHMVLYGKTGGPSYRTPQILHELLSYVFFLRKTKRYRESSAVDPGFRPQRGTIHVSTCLGYFEDSPDQARRTQCVLPGCSFFRSFYTFSIPLRNSMKVPLGGRGRERGPETHLSKYGRRTDGLRGRQFHRQEGCDQHVEELCWAVAVTSPTWPVSPELWLI